MLFGLDLFSGKRVDPFDGFTDFHSHILPGVDDGVPDIAQSLEILDAYEHAGFSKVWLTPHVMEDVPNRADFLKGRFEELKGAYKGSIELHLAAENMIDNLFFERLESGELLPIGENSDMLLVETSFFQPPIDLDQAFDAIKRKGFNPLLAHPERYMYISDMKSYKRLVDNGVRFQLNVFSLMGQYGPVVRKKAFDIAKAGLYSCAGTDIHRSHQLSHLSLSRYKSKELAQLAKIASRE